jgi:hypothetical protein
MRSDVHVYARARWTWDVCARVRVCVRGWGVCWCACVLDDARATVWAAWGTSVDVSPGWLPGQVPPIRRPTRVQEPATPTTPTPSSLWASANRHTCQQHPWCRQWWEGRGQGGPRCGPGLPIAVSRIRAVPCCRPYPLSPSILHSHSRSHWWWWCQRCGRRYHPAFPQGFHGVATIGRCVAAFVSARAGHRGLPPGVVFVGCGARCWVRHSGVRPSGCTVPAGAGHRSAPGVPRQCCRFVLGPGLVVVGGMCSGVQRCKGALCCGGAPLRTGGGGGVCAGSR